MNTNRAKEFFLRCRRLEQRINGLMEESERLRALATRSTTSYSDEPRGGGGNQSRVENATLKLVALERELNGQIDEFVDCRRKAYSVFERLSDDRHRDILRWRYLSLWSWEKIAHAFGLIDRTQVWRLHGRALTEANLLLDQPAQSDCVKSIGSNVLQRHDAL